MTNLEMLRKCTPEQIRAAFCEEYCGDCEVCPSFLSDRCKYGKNGVLEWLNDEANTPKDAPNDAPKGWIKLKAATRDIYIYINASKIVALTHATRANGESAKAITKVYTVGAEDNPWVVDESIDAVMEKIKNA